MSPNSGIPLITQFLFSPARRSVTQQIKWLKLQNEITHPQRPTSHVTQTVQLQDPQRTVNPLHNRLHLHRQPHLPEPPTVHITMRRTANLELQRLHNQLKQSDTSTYLIGRTVHSQDLRRTLKPYHQELQLQINQYAPPHRPTVRSHPTVCSRPT